MSSSLNVDLSGMLPLGEKWKILNQIAARTERHQVDDVLNGCKDQPASLFNLLKFLLADKFHRSDLMIDLLYAGDATLLNKIVSKRWMYEGENNSFIDSQFLLEQLFPKVSYICREKVLRRIGRHSRNEIKIDQLWNAVEKMYGFDVAFPLFEACSRNVISSVIADRQVKLSGYQVVTLLQKYPDIGLEYFKNNNVACSKMNPRCSPIHYLFEHRPDDFLDLCINHSDKLYDFQIGRNRSTKLIRGNRNKLLEHPDKTTSLLTLDRIQREFSSEEFQKLFESTLSSDPCNLQYCWTWVCKVPTYRQVNMVNQAYKNLYKIDLNEHPDYMNEEYLFLLPEERRRQIVEWKTERVEKESMSLTWSFKGISEYVWRDGKERAFTFLPLKPISHSAPELKKLLLIEQNVERRATLCRYLIQTCYFNDDLSELLNVLKLLSKRTRNDQPDVRKTILSTVHQIKEMEFSKEHWDIIMEIIQVSLVFKDPYCDQYMDSIVGKHIAFRLESRLPFDDLLTMHIKLKMQRHYDLSFDNEHVKNPADQRVLLESYAKELERLELNNDLFDYNENKLEEERLTDFVMKLVDKIWKFNCDNKNGGVEPISLSSLQWLMSKFERIAKEEEQKLDEHCNRPTSLPSNRRNGRYFRDIGYHFWNVPNKLLKLIQWLKDEQNHIVDAFHGSDYYFSKMWLHLPNHQTILHFLEKNPSHLVENWTASISRMLELKACVALMRTLKYWNYSTLVSQTISQCTELVQAELGEKPDAIELNRKCNALLVLSSLMEPSDFLALVTRFYPNEKEVDVFAEKSGENYKMSVAATRALINISIPHLAFDALKKFSVGDYLKLIINSFYSQMQRAQSTESLDFLRQQLTNVPVSLHKHIIRLYCTISSVDSKTQALKGVDSSNVSIRYVVFLQLGKLFRSHPTQEIFALLKSVIESTTKDDATILEFLYSTPEVHTCPLKYISDYTNVCLSVLHKLEPSKVDTFIAHLVSIIKKMPADSLDAILMHDVENAESFNRAFCVAYLKNSTSEPILKHRLVNICRVLDNVIKRGWNRKSENQEYLTRTLVLDFIGDLANGVEDSSEVWLENQICQTLLDKFKAMSTSTFFWEILTLHLGLLHVEVIKYNGTERINQFGKRFAQLVDFMADYYGNELIVMSIGTIIWKINQIFSTEISANNCVVVELADVILQASATRANQIVAIKILKDVTTPKEAKVIETLEKINKVFIESNDVSIQSYYASVNR